MKNFFGNDNALFFSFFWKHMFANTLLLFNFTYFYVAKEDPKVCNFVNTATEHLVESTSLFGRLRTCSTVENMYIPVPGEGVCVIYTCILSYMTSLHKVTGFKTCKFLSRYIICHRSSLEEKLK